MSKKKYLDGEEMKVIMRAITEQFPGMGFILLSFNYGDDHRLANYISTANREDCIKFLRETADRLEKRTDYQTPTNN